MAFNIVDTIQAVNQSFHPSEIASQPEDFFGRDKELQLLERSLSKRSVAIQGPVGIGKSSVCGQPQQLQHKLVYSTQYSAKMYFWTVAITITCQTMPGILDAQAPAHVAAYNRHCLHYNLVAESIYAVRRPLQQMTPDFHRYVIAGLLAFDMGRTMGLREHVYCDRQGFAYRLADCLSGLTGQIDRLWSVSDLIDVRLQEYRFDVIAIYDRLAESRCLHAENHFHVGATKIMHWLNPGLFIMIDSNVAHAFKNLLSVPFRSGTTGYSSERYFECLMKAQLDIGEYGHQQFRQLELGTPAARVFDKVAFVRGQRSLVPFTL